VTRIIGHLIANPLSKHLSSRIYIEIQNAVKEKHGSAVFAAAISVMQRSAN